MMTEEEAKVTRCCGPDGCGRLLAVDETENSVKARFCIASKCMAWRWIADVNYDGHGRYTDTSKTRGYCGLAGKVFI